MTHDNVNVDLRYIAGIHYHDGIISWLADINGVPYYLEEYDQLSRYTLSYALYEFSEDQLADFCTGKLGFNAFRRTAQSIHKMYQINETGKPAYYMALQRLEMPTSTMLSAEENFYVGAFEQEKFDAYTYPILTRRKLNLLL